MRAEDAIAKRAKGFGGFLDSCVHAEVVRKAAVKERAEIDEGLGKADLSPHASTMSEVSPSPYALTRAGQYMVSVLFFLLGEPTCIRSPKSRRCA
jgi:hypothetical protein